LVASCHDCSEGGIAVAAAESAFAGGFGMSIDAGKIPVAKSRNGRDKGTKRTESIKENAPSAASGLNGPQKLFSESNSRFVVTVAPENKAAFEAALVGCVFAEIGTVTDDNKFTVTVGSDLKLIDTTIDELKEAWISPLRW
jgi:phosphoribosylformylglycinamidine (FGAM) synthase-like enzyme